MPAKTYPRIDTTIERLRTFVVQHPGPHVLLEALPAGTRAKAIEKRVGEFIDHDAIAAWSKKRRPPSAQRLATLSAPYRYFIEKYGSLTWLVGDDGIGDVYGFTSHLGQSGSSLVHLPLPFDSEIAVEPHHGIGYDLELAGDDFDEEAQWKLQSQPFDAWLKATIDDHMKKLRATK